MMVTKREVLEVIQPILEQPESITSEQFFDAREKVRAWLAKPPKQYRASRFNQTLSEAWTAVENGETHRCNDLLIILKKNK